LPVDFSGVCSACLTLSGQPLRPATVGQIALLERGKYHGNFSPFSRSLPVVLAVIINAFFQRVNGSC
jgi:hypothetical protein